MPTRLDAIERKLDVIVLAIRDLNPGLSLDFNARRVFRKLPEPPPASVFRPTKPFVPPS